ncbi:MAG: sigma-70 family RNA polymerase sigma factor [Gilvibacter sp.]
MALEQLINRCKQQDAKAQEELYKLYAGKLFSVCLKYSRNYADAQDNLQDSFLTIFRTIVQFKHKGSFEGWMKRVTVNTVLQKYRKQRVFDLVKEEQIEAHDELVEDTDVSLDYLLGIVQELPDRYRLVFNLYVLDGYSHNEIAEMLEISSGTSKSNLARARMILKNKVIAYKKDSNANGY